MCDHPGVSATLDARELRRLMASWATGVAVVTSRDGSGPRGATTNALTSLSLDPLLVLVALDHGSNTLAAVRNTGRFCINVLAAGQEEIARRFATKASGEVDGGDHTILIGRPLEAGADPDAQPLVFYGGRFHAGAFD